MACVLALTGCGLVYDAVQWIYPIAKDDLQRVCARQRLRVGISVEPFRPFVFPAVFTDEGVRITGMDVDLVRELASALGRWCGGGEPIVPTLHLVRVRDQFVELNENKLDLIVSAVTANVPLEQAAGIAYSIPYYDDGAIVGDVEHTSAAEVAGAITPVPGGTGPMTNVMLLRNVLRAARGS